jgi:hypothetical protein
MVRHDTQHRRWPWQDHSWGRPEDHALSTGRHGQEFASEHWLHRNAQMWGLEDFESLSSTEHC